MEDITVYAPRPKTPDITDHEQWPLVLDAITDFGGCTKEQLIHMAHDPEIDGRSKSALRRETREKLLAICINYLFKEDNS